MTGCVNLMDVGTPSLFTSLVEVPRYGHLGLSKPPAAGPILIAFCGHEGIVLLYSGHVA